MYLDSSKSKNFLAQCDQTILPYDAIFRIFKYSELKEALLSQLGQKHEWKVISNVANLEITA